MNPKQLSLTFPGHLTTRTLWELQIEGIDDAANIAIDLLNKGDKALFEDIASIRCLLQPGELIPPEKALPWTENVVKIHDERHHIKDAIEERSEYRLVIIGEKGQSARLNGRGAACGFALRGSEAGIQDDKAQYKLAHGLMKAAIRRTPTLLHDPDVQALGIPALIGNGDD
jgi:hypothetical protein